VIYTFQSNRFDLNILKKERKVISRILIASFVIALSGCVSADLEKFKITQDNESTFRSQLVVEILKIDSRRHSPLRLLAPSYRISEASIGPYNGWIRNSDDATSKRCVYLKLTSHESALGGSFQLGILVSPSIKKDTNLIYFNNMVDLIQKSICTSPQDSLPFPELVGQIIQRGSGFTL
jgi:hypothetical protein